LQQAVIIPGIFKAFSFRAELGGIALFAQVEGAFDL
jgi:hypothetical protein